MSGPYLLQADALRLPLQDQSVDAILTSPPYNAGKPYKNDSWPDHEEYIAFLRAAYAECRRVARGPVCWVLPLMIRKRFLYAEVGEWQFCTPIIASSENVAVAPGQFGRGWMRAYVGVELLVCTHYPPSMAVWIIAEQGFHMGEPIFAPQLWIGDNSRNRPREHPCPFVREIPGAAMRMFPECRTWLDPFAGTGTTAMVGRNLGRSVILCEIEPRFLTIQRQELAQGVLWDEASCP